MLRRKKQERKWWKKSFDQSPESEVPSDWTLMAPASGGSEPPLMPESAAGINEEEIAPTLENWVEALTVASEEVLEEITKEVNKDYIITPWWRRTLYNGD